MPSQLVDAKAPSLREGPNRSPAELPHGLLTPPPEVQEQIENERPKHLPEAFAGAEPWLVNLWTVAYHFDYLGHEVLYRETAAGPEVLAVGRDEVFALKRSMPLAEVLQLKTFLG